MNIKLVALATVVLTLLICPFAAVAQDVPTLRYKVDFDSNEQPIVQKVEDSQALSVMEEAFNMGTAMETATGAQVWVATDANGRMVQALPAGPETADALAALLQNIGAGARLQVVPAPRFENVSFWNNTSIEEMETKIRAQLRSAADAFKTEACNVMADWDTVNFAFEIGADAIVVAKINASGSFTPSKVCVQ